MSIILGSRLEKSLKPWHTVGTYFLFLSTNHVTKSCSLKRQYNESWIWVKIFKLATVKCTVRYTAGTLALPSKSKVKVLNYPKPCINVPSKATKSYGVFSIEKYTAGRVGHCVLFRSEHSILFRSFKECSVLFVLFWVFGDLWDPKEHSVLSCSFQKSWKERKERNMLLQRT